MQPPEHIKEAVRSLFRAATLGEKRQIVETHHADLLTDTADQVLATAQQTFRDDPTTPHNLEPDRTLLRRCREVGIAAAFAQMAHQQAAQSIAPALLSRLQQVQRKEELRQLIDEHPDLLPVLEQIVRAMGHHPPTIPPHFQERVQQAQAAEQRYRQRNDVAALDVAVAAWESILNDATFAAAPERFRLAVMNDASITLSYRSTARGNAADLDRAITLAQAAVAATPPDSPYSPGYRTNLGNRLRERYGRTGQAADLDAAIEHAQAAVAATPPDSPDYAMYCTNLVGLVRQRYRRSGQVADLDAAIEHAQAAVEKGAPTDPRYPVWRTNLGLSLAYRYARTGQAADLAAAIAHAQAAVAMMGSPTDPRYPGC